MEKPNEEIQAEEIEITDLIERIEKLEEKNRSLSDNIDQIERDLIELSDAVFELVDQT